MMTFALKAAKKSERDIAIGAIIVRNGEIISSACNRKELNNDVTEHAEIIVIKEASKKLNRWRLDDCDLYVTLEPCPMCAWAILQARIKNVYFGSYDTNYGALGSKLDLRKILNSNTKVYGGIMEDECNNLLKTYFQNIRK